MAHARRLAVVLHRMWTDGTDFRWGSEPGTAVAALRKPYSITELAEALARVTTTMKLKD